jgi:hypothetical protein
MITLYKKFKQYLTVTSLTEEDRLCIKNLAENFTRSTLGETDPEHMCFTICYPLHLHLMNNGFNNSLSGGTYQNTSHYWLDLDDEDKTIVDPTIRQFNKDAPFLFIGKKPTDYPDDSNYNFDEPYQCWLDGLLGRRPGLPEGFVEKLISINLKALSILITETDPQIFSSHLQFKMYYDGILKALHKFPFLKEQLLKSNM